MLRLAGRHRLESLAIAFAVRLASHLTVGYHPPTFQKFEAATWVKQFRGGLG